MSETIDPIARTPAADGDRLNAFLLWLGEAGGPSGAVPRAALLRGVSANADHLSAALGEGEPAPIWWNADWRGLDLSDADLAAFNLSGADFGHARLKRTALRGVVARAARFEDALIEEADFADGDLSGSRFRGALAGQASFNRAMLEDSSFGGATLRFADFREALLDEADFANADCWGARFAGADADRTVFRGARLDEADLSDVNLTYADFTGASLRSARLGGSRLRGARFDGATFAGTDLSDADLRGVTLVRADLSTCDLRHVRLDGAWIEGCRLRVEQLGGAVGEEIDRNYEAARGSYTALETNFTGLGAKAEAGWAYKKGRQMNCLASREKARGAWRARRWKPFALHGYAYASDRFVEWLCDYGESLSRIVRAFVLLIVLFAGFYGLDGSLVPEGAGAPTRNVLDLVSYSALNMLTSNPPEIGIAVMGRAANILVGLQGGVGIILMGLFGYVLGNRIRR